LKNATVRPQLLRDQLPLTDKRPGDSRSALL
jgi:hypothetical protein